MSEFRIAQIGFGSWGPNLTKALSKIPNVKLDAIVESNILRHEEIKKLYPAAHCYIQYKKLLQLNLDAVIISTPPSTHFNLAKEMLEAGLHIFVEKPFVTTILEAEKLFEIAQEKKLMIMVGHVFLFHDAFKYLKSNLGRLGRLLYIQTFRNNFGIIRQDVNAWWNLAPHDISMLLSLMHEEMPLTISVVGDAMIQPNIEDYATANLEWRNGVKAQINVNWLYPQKMRKLIAVGSEKMMIFDDCHKNKIEVVNKKVQLEQSQLIEYSNGELEVPLIYIQEPLINELQHFVNAAQNGSSCLSGIEHAFKVTKILELGNYSLKNGGLKIDISADKFEYSTC